MYNATNAATWLWAPQRFATRLRVLRRASPQFNSTICLSIYHRIAAPRDVSLLGSLQRKASQRNVTLLSDLFVNLSSLQAAALLDFPQRYASLLNDLFISFRASTRSDLARRVAAPRIAPQLNDLFVTPRLVASPRIAAPRLFTQRNDLFVTPRGNVAYSIAALFYSTQRFVCYTASPRSNTHLYTAQRNPLIILLTSTK
jgi:hypothetical protein